MKDAKLTVRVPRGLLENIKEYAVHNNTTLTALIEAYLRQIPTKGSLENAPLVRNLSGTLPKDVSIRDYLDYLDEKYDQ